MSAFILSATDFGDLINSRRVKRCDLEARNVRFMDTGGTRHIQQLLERALARTE